MTTPANLGEPAEAIIARFEARQQQLARDLARLEANLPLKYLRQQAHFTTPASDFTIAAKAVAGGFAATQKILERFNLSPADLAATLGVPEPAVIDLLAGDPRSPFVMIDGEDAQALRDDVVRRGRENAVKLFTEADWGPALRIYRPSGLNLRYAARDLVEVLTRAGQGRSPEAYPIDGIVFPKIDHPAEIEWVCDLLGEIERAIGLVPNQIKLEFLVESGWSVVNLPELVRRSIDRLAGIIFGIADYSADIGLPEVTNNHPVCDWARAAIVNLAGAAGVPAIDNMTVNYPVADPNLSPEQNRVRLLARLKECFDDAIHGLRLGMDGKWVGHPAQLFVTLLAFRTYLSDEEVHAEAAAIEEYSRAVEREQGATIISGVMVDRALDRHSRSKLRKAVALGRLDVDRAQRLGIITAAEASGLRGGH
ncbi:MAG: hypothetical protein IT336_01385 [Thermomicrobiales bacterium]|nr:hypothetical protein [Thermomicrobiales bacterium]